MLGNVDFFVEKCSVTLKWANKVLQYEPQVTWEVCEEREEVPVYIIVGSCLSW